LTTAPLIISAFGQISIIATVANLAVVPLMSGAVGVGLIAVVVGVASADVATLFNAANWSLLKAALLLAGLCATPDWAAIDISLPAIPVLLATVCGILSATKAVRSKHLSGCILIVGLCFANYFVWSKFIKTDEVVIRVLDVGQGDGILVTFPNGKNILIDGEIPGFGEDAGERVILPALRYLGIRRLDAVVASHPHADHVGGLVSVLDRVEVAHYLDSGQYYHSWTARRIHCLIEEEGISYHTVAAGDSILGFGEAGIVVLHPLPSFVNPDGEAPDGLNNGSVVVKITYRGKSILLTGGIEHETDSPLLAWGDVLRSSILKAAHHGSRTSSSMPFLKAVSPDWVAISCGIDNKFRHPSPEVLAWYRELDIAGHRTDLVGCLTYRMGAGGVSVAGHLEGKQNETVNLK
jgi:competence protein ComEC